MAKPMTPLRWRIESIARGGRAKPAPDVFLEAAAAEGVASAHCW